MPMNLAINRGRGMKAMSAEHLIVPILGVLLCPFTLIYLWDLMRNDAKAQKAI